MLFLSINNASAYRCYKTVGFNGIVMKEDEYAIMNGQRWKIIELEITEADYQSENSATQLLERVCKDALQDGFDIVEAYPYKESSYQSSYFGGHFEMYKRSGFYVPFVTEKGSVMRKKLK